MAASSPPLFAVLTGDIIKSQSLSNRELESVRKSLLGAVDFVRDWRSGIVKGKAEFFRGDAWQVLLSDASLALRVALFLRASLLAGGIADTRVAIGLGTVSAVSRSRVSLSVGEAFVRSGHGLDELTVYSEMTIQVPPSNGALQDWLPVVAQLCDGLIRRWTARQAEIVSLALQPGEVTHEQIASDVKPVITRQAATKALESAGWPMLRSVVRQFERTAWSG